MGRNGNEVKRLPTIWHVPDELWDKTRPIINQHDPSKHTGRKRIDPRAALDTIIFRMRSGCQWNQLPKEFRYHAGQKITQPPVWPDEPEPPRYRYFGQLTGEENFYRPGEKAANAGVRFFRWLVGLVDHSPNPVLLQRPQAVITDQQGRIYVSDVNRYLKKIYE